MKKPRVERDRNNSRTFPCHQLAFDSEKRCVSGGKDEPIQRTQAASSCFVCLDPRRMASTKRSGGKTRFLPGKVSVDISQEIIELRSARKAFPRPRDFGIPHHRPRKVAPSLAALAEELVRPGRRDLYSRRFPANLHQKIRKPNNVQFQIPITTRMYSY